MTKKIPDNYISSADVVRENTTAEEVNNIISNMNIFFNNKSIPKTVRDFARAYFYLKLTDNYIFDCSHCFNVVVEKCTSKQKSLILSQMQESTE